MKRVRTNQEREFRVMLGYIVRVYRVPRKTGDVFTATVTLPAKYQSLKLVVSNQNSDVDEFETYGDVLDACLQFLQDQFQEEV